MKVEVSIPETAPLWNRTHHRKTISAGIANTCPWHKARSWKYSPTKLDQYSKFGVLAHHYSWSVYIPHRRLFSVLELQKSEKKYASTYITTGYYSICAESLWVTQTLPTIMKSAYLYNAQKIPAQSHQKLQSTGQSNRPANFSRCPQSTKMSCRGGGKLQQKWSDAVNVTPSRTSSTYCSGYNDLTTYGSTLSLAIPPTLWFLCVWWEES